MNKVGVKPNISIRPKYRGIFLIAWIFCLSLLSACSGDNSDLHELIDEVRARPGKPIEPIPEYKPAKSYAFPTHLKRRDPFFSYTINTTKKKTPDVNAPDQSRTRQPLEAFTLDSLRMVGVLKQGGTIWALVEAPNRLVYRVTVGTYLGKNYGRVVRVTEKFIRLVETVRDGEKWRKKTVKMKLQTKKFELINNNKK